METTWDKLRAVLFALGVHAFALALLFVGLLWEPVPAVADAEGPMIEATLVTSPQQSAAVAKAIVSAQKQDATQKQTVAQKQDVAPPPQPKLAPNPQDAPQPQQLVAQERLPKPDTVDQDEVRRAAELAAEQKQEQDERRKQAQIDLTAQIKQQQDAENRQRLAQQELDQQKLLQAIRKQRADAARQVMLEEQKMKQLQDQAARVAQSSVPPPVAAPPGPAHPSSGNVGKNADLVVQYKKAIRDQIQQNWHTANVPENVHCNVQIKQLPGGEVFDVTFLPGCPFDPTARATVVDALKRSPLPYAGFESVFTRQVTMDMCYPDEVCTK